jgi:hypothetical protein
LHGIDCGDLRRTNADPGSAKIESAAWSKFILLAFRAGKALAVASVASPGKCTIGTTTDECGERLHSIKSCRKGKNRYLIQSFPVPLATLETDKPFSIKNLLHFLARCSIWRVLTGSEAARAQAEPLY